jgi:thioredoxin reductase (NADPH)
MSGTQFLEKAIKLYPDSRKVLLTAYADTEAAIASINTIGLDHYLMKPWHPPEQNLYPVLDDLLSDWLASVPLPYDGIRVAGTQWSPGSHHVKDFLARNQIPYQWLDIEKEMQARELVETVSQDPLRLPLLFFPDGSVLFDPDLKSLAEKIGLKTQASQPFYDLIIIGAGPAGLAAAVYGASEGLRTIVIEKEAAGGQAGTSARIENYLGFPKGVSGADLARRAAAQAQRLGAEILTAQEAKSVRVEGPYRLVTLSDGSELSCHALLIASGVSIRELDIPGIKAITGAGVYYGAAITEALNCQGRHVFVIGGANSAGQGAVFLSRYASKVTMLVRGDSLEANMSQYLIDQINQTGNIEVLLCTEAAEVTGKDRLETITIVNRTTGKTETLPALAMFIFAGAVPHAEIVAGIVERNEAGFILTGPDLIHNGQRPGNWKLSRDPFLLETSVPGIFAAGDVREGAVRRVASAVGQGSIAISFVHQYLKTV